MPVVKWGAANGPIVETDPRSHKGRDGDGGVGWAKSGRAHLLDRIRADLGEAGEGVHVAGLALIGPHSLGGVTLQMLDGAITLSCGKIYIRFSHVALKVDEHLAASIFGTGRAPKGLNGCFVLVIRRE